MRLDPIVQKRLDELLVKADAIKAARTGHRFRAATIYHVSPADVAGWSVSAESLLFSVLGESSVHLRAVRDARDKFHIYESQFDTLRSLIAAAREDYLGGYLFQARALVKAEVLDDALVQAESLLQSDFKDPACILIGVALEVTIKELARQGGIAEGKLDRMNVDLCKAGKYNLTKQKQITAWADLRNKAAHGEWNEYNKADVMEMFSGVQRFIGDYLQ